MTERARSAEGHDIPNPPDPIAISALQHWS